MNKDGLVRDFGGKRCCCVVLQQVSPCLLENLNAVEVWIGGSLREVVSDVLNFIFGDWVAVFPVPKEPESICPGHFTVSIHIEWSTEELESLRSIGIGPHDISRLYSDLAQVDKSKTCQFPYITLPFAQHAGLLNASRGPYESNEDQIESEEHG